MNTQFLIPMFTMFFGLKKSVGQRKHVCGHKEEEDTISYMTNYIHKIKTQSCVEVQSFVVMKPERHFSLEFFFF